MSAQNHKSVGAPIKIINW